MFCALVCHKSQGFVFTTHILVRQHHLKSPHFLHKTYCSNGCCAVVDLLSWRQLVLLGLKLHKRKGSILGRNYNLLESVDVDPVLSIDQITPTTQAIVPYIIAVLS